MKKDIITAAGEGLSTVYFRPILFGGHTGSSRNYQSWDRRTGVIWKQQASKYSSMERRGL